MSNLKNLQSMVLPKRMDKTIDWLGQSRDAWKSKCLEAKSALKIKTLTVKRLRDGKSIWKQRIKKLKEEIYVIKGLRDTYSNEIERLKAELNAKNLEIVELKKKRSYIRRG